MSRNKIKIVGDWRFHEDGSVYKITLDPEDGDFSINLEGYSKIITAKTLEEVREQARRWMEKNSGVEFKPVIIVEAGSDFHNDKVHAQRHDIDFKYDRAFTGTRKDGTRIWRHWNHVDDVPEGKDMSWSDTLEGTPGHVESRHIGDKEVEIPYTKEKWLALRQLTRMVQALSLKLIEIRESGKMEGFLVETFKKGPARLLQAKGPLA